MSTLQLSLLIAVIVSAVAVLALINEESSLINTAVTNAKAAVDKCAPKSLD